MVSIKEKNCAKGVGNKATGTQSLISWIIIISIALTLLYLLIRPDDIGFYRFENHLLSERNIILDKLEESEWVAQLTRDGFVHVKKVSDGDFYESALAKTPPITCGIFISNNRDMLSRPERVCLYICYKKTLTIVNSKNDEENVTYTLTSSDMLNDMREKVYEYWSKRKDG